MMFALREKERVGQKADVVSGMHCTSYIGTKCVQLGTVGLKSLDVNLCEWSLAPVSIRVRKTATSDSFISSGATYQLDP